jgi:hypothetical protein
MKRYDVLGINPSSQRSLGSGYSTNELAKQIIKYHSECLHVYMAGKSQFGTKTGAHIAVFLKERKRDRVPESFRLFLYSLSLVSGVCGRAGAEG